MRFFYVAVFFVATLRLPRARAEHLTIAGKHGTAISVEKLGSGPPLVLVHGSGEDGASAWGRVAAILARRFTVYVMDRTGHGASGDRKKYAVTDEAADIAAVSRTAGKQTIVVAHSYGALCALAKPAALTNISHLVLYEPAMQIGATPPDKKQLFKEYEKALSDNNPDRAAVLGMRIAGIPESVIAQERGSGEWAKRVRRLAIDGRELRTVNEFRVAPSQLRAYPVPTTVLVGSRTRGYLQESASFVCSRIPSCHTVTLEGQGHVATVTAPQLLADVIVREAGFH
jgi:pimeloyl-ACP methyl ester carboxylesterase